MSVSERESPVAHPEVRVVNNSLIISGPLLAEVIEAYETWNHRQETGASIRHYVRHLNVFRDGTGDHYIVAILEVKKEE